MNNSKIKQVQTRLFFIFILILKKNFLRIVTVFSLLYSSYSQRLDSDVIYMIEYQEYSNNIEDHQIFGVLDDEWTPYEYINLPQIYGTDRDGNFSMNYIEYQDAYITIMRSILYLGGEPDIIYEQTINHTPEQLQALKEEYDKNQNNIGKVINALKERGFVDIRTERKMEDPYWSDKNEWEIYSIIYAKFLITEEATFKETYKMMDFEEEVFKDYYLSFWGCFNKNNGVITKNIEILYDEIQGKFVKNFGD